MVTSAYHATANCFQRAELCRQSGARADRRALSCSTDLRLVGARVAHLSALTLPRDMTPKVVYPSFLPPPHNTTDSIVHVLLTVCSGERLIICFCYICIPPKELRVVRWELCHLSSQHLWEIVLVGNLKT